ncbi:MAG: N-acetylglucosamine-6-phosphate deacetylase [Blastocatellia bacterium]|jgi:N-acetylglucosamine-6-phosphate deacetylase
MRIRGKVTSEETVDLTITDGTITAIEPARLGIPCDGGSESLYLLPGFLDLQLNGYLGIDFNAPSTSPEEILEATRRVRQTGVTGFCPTIITGSSEHIEACISTLVRAIDRYPEVAAAVIGLHIEGPYISLEDGPRGAHPRADVRPPDWTEFQRWQTLAGGRIQIVTLAPEWPESVEFIRQASEAGLVVALGHTAASPAQIRAAVDAGARLSTHLGNGSHAKIDRHPNYIWEQLADDRLSASLIVDGHHLPESVVKCFIRVKSPARTILVTDAIAAAGLPSGKYYLGNVEVEVTPARRVNLPGTPYLAGSVLEMPTAIALTVAYAGVSLREAVEMATANPSELLGLGEKRGSIRVGQRADLLLAVWRKDPPHLDIAEVILA